MTLLEWATPVAAAVALAVLWIAEAVFPLFHHKPRSGRKARHFALAGMNAGVAALFSGLTLAVVTLGEARGWGILRWLQLEALADDVGPTAVGIAWGLLALLLLDGWHYGFHVLAHKTPLLWKLHAVHHTDPDVDATTAMRFHCGEIAAQCFMSLPVYLLLGVGMSHVLLYNVVLLPVALFHHANVNVPERVDRAMRWLIVTPRMHIVHHSKWTPETDSNFAAVLSIWDRVFGTFRRRPDPRTIDLGLDGFEPQHVYRLRGMLAQPVSGAKSEHGTPPDPQHLPSQTAASASSPRDPASALRKSTAARGSG
mgnify:CR=1 FL=1